MASGSAIASNAPAGPASDPDPADRYSEGKVGARAWALVAVLMLLYAVAFLDRHIITLMIGPIRADLGISDFEVGLLQGIGFALFYALFGLPLGWLVDRTSRRGIIFAGISIWSFCAAAGALAKSFPQLFLARLGVGAGEAALSPAAYSMIADSFPRGRVTTALGAYAGGAAIGAAASIGLGGYLVAFGVANAPFQVPVLGNLNAWQFVFLVTGLPGFFLGLLIFLVPEPKRTSRAASERISVRRFLREHRRFLTCHHLGFAMLQLIAFASASWTPTYLIRVFHWPVTDVGLVLAGQSLVSVATAIGMGIYVDRQFRGGRTDAHLQFYLFATPLILVLLGAAFAMPGAPAFLIFSTLATALLPMAGIASAAVQVATPGALRGQVSALYLLVINLIGLGIGPALPPLLSDVVFGDESMIGWGIFTAAMIAGPVAIGFFLYGRAPMRRAVDVAEQQG